MEERRGKEVKTALRKRKAILSVKISEGFWQLRTLTIGKKLQSDMRFKKAVQEKPGKKGMEKQRQSLDTSQRRQKETRERSKDSVSVKIKEKPTAYVIPLS